MPRVSFTANLQRHVALPSMDVQASTVRQALEQVFARVPSARGYVLDDQDAVRKHISVFVDGEQIADRRALSDPLRPDSDIWVMQALSGG